MTTRRSTTTSWLFLWSFCLYGSIGRTTVSNAIPLHRHRFTASQEQLRQLEEYEDQRESIRRAVAKQWDRFYNDYFDKMKAYALQIQFRRYNALLRRQALERATIADTMRQFGLSSAGLLSTRSSGEEEEKPKSPFGELRPVKNAPAREANRSSKALDSVVNS